MVAVTSIRYIEELEKHVSNTLHMSPELTPYAWDLYSLLLRKSVNCFFTAFSGKLAAVSASLKSMKTKKGKNLVFVTEFRSIRINFSKLTPKKDRSECKQFFSFSFSCWISTLSAK